MPTLYSELPAGAQAAYSEAYEATRHAELHRSVASLTGTFQTKSVKGKRYWYFAYRDALDGRVRQIYVGPDSDDIEALKARTSQPPDTGVARIAAAALAHGCGGVTPKHFRIIRQIGDAGFFRAGGMLIGSHAFVALGNMLGVRWASSTQTQDIDFAHGGRNISVALPANLEIDVRTAIESLQMGLLPSLGLSGNPSGSYVNPSEPDLRLDFLTTRGRSDEPVEIPSLNISLQPLKFLELLLEQPAQAALLADQGAVVVNVPDPARFALHKMIVAVERTTSERAKAIKDLNQAAAVIECMLDQGYSDALREQTTDILGRGTGWRSRLVTALTRLKARHPELAERFTKLTQI